MSFYKWDQNNSGGSFVVNDRLTHRVVIEADTYKEAEEKAFDMGIYYNGCDMGMDCGCCGDRWHDGEEVKLPSDYSMNDYNDPKNFMKVTGRKEIILNTLDEYLQHLTDNYGWESPDARVFYKDGSVKEFFKEEK